MQNSFFKTSNAIPTISVSLKALATATVIAATVLVSSAHAKSLGRPCTSAPESQWLTKQELQTKIAALGYNVQKIKIDKGCAEFYTLGNDGSKIELFVDPTNGNIVGQIVGDSKK
ncbi:MAG: PepSY domain-containing protein [Proteobacteria bacterium]|nr:PepSY domain-containing protein [Pseudomonadota bacterium]